MDTSESGHHAWETANAIVALGFGVGRWISGIITAEAVTCVRPAAMMDMAAVAVLDSGCGEGRKRGGGAGRGATGT